MAIGLVQTVIREGAPRLVGGVQFSGAEGFKSSRPFPPNLITHWKTQLLENAAAAFGESGKDEEINVKSLHAKIGQLTLENDFLEKALGRVGGPSVKR